MKLMRNAASYSDDDIMMMMFVLRIRQRLRLDLQGLVRSTEWSMSVKMVDKTDAGSAVSRTCCACMLGCKSGSDASSHLSFSVLLHSFI